MSGFEIFLCVLAGIILFFVLILSIPVHVSFTYSDMIYLTIRYLFLKINILPIDPNKKKKPKKEKKPKKPKEEKPAEQTDEKPKEKKPNAILEMVKANGYDGMMVVISNLGRILGKYGGKLFRSVIFDEIEIYVTVGTGDAASTAIKYGKTCQKVYPFIGFICNNNVVHKYDVNVEPDFLANESNGEMNLEFHLIIRKIINATVAMAVRLVFGVLLKFLKGAKSNKKTANDTVAANNKNTVNNS
ncbi:MAG: DUF2953 domain-containing protein [Acutalibacteraceae bacterium]